MADFFIRRPIVAIVAAIVITLLASGQIRCVKIRVGQIGIR